MKLVSVVLSLLLLHNSSFGQTKKFHSLERLVDDHVANAKPYFNKSDKIFVTVDFEDTLSYQDKIIPLHTSINPRSFKKRDRVYLVRFIVNSGGGGFIVSAVNFRVLKKSRRRISLLNLGNRDKYELVPLSNVGLSQ